MDLTVEYSAEELSPNKNGQIQTFDNLLNRIQAYFMSKDGRDSRMNESSTITINEILPVGLKVETRRRTRDLYIRQVTVYDAYSNIVTREVDDGKIGGYNSGKSEEFKHSFGFTPSPGIKNYIGYFT